MNKFCDRLRELRSEKGISQADLSKMLKLSRSRINMYERGEREPNFETLELLGDFFNVDLDYLLGKSDIKNKSPISPAEYTNQEIELTSEEEHLISVFRTLSPDGKSYVLQTVDMAAMVYKQKDTDISAQNTATG